MSDCGPSASLGRSPLKNLKEEAADGFCCRARQPCGCRTSVSVHAGCYGGVIRRLWAATPEQAAADSTGVTG